MIKKITAFVLGFVMLICVSGVAPLTADAAFSKEEYYRNSIAEYKNNFTYLDPQYITDEDFFGKWNDETQEWEKTPYFIYGPEIEEQTEIGEKLIDIAVDREELAKVEEAAKLGNYELCKEELLNYYKNKHKGYNMAYTPSDHLSSSDAAKYESMLDNMTWTIAPTAKFHIYDEPAEIEVDVTSEMKQLVSYNNALSSMKLVFGAGRKDGYVAEIDVEAMEPYVTATINGEIMKFPLTTAVNLDNSTPDTPNPTPGKLYVEESVSSINSEMTIDENTKRSIMQFDIPGLTSKWQVDSATLHLKARRIEDSPSQDESPLMQTDWKNVYVFPWRETNTIDANMTFNDLYGEHGVDFRSFSGEAGPRDYCAHLGGEVDYTLHYMSYLSVLYWQSSYYGEVFQYHAIRSLLNAIIQRGDWEKFMADYESYITNFTPLRIAEQIFSGLRFLHYYMESEYMTPEAFTMILKYVYFVGRWLEENWMDAFDYVNHGSYSVQAQQWICFLYPEFRDVYGPLNCDEAGKPIITNSKYQGSVSGGWLEVSVFRQAYKQAADINTDGSSIEGSPEYALEGMSGYLAGISIGKQLNLDTAFCYKTKWSVEANERLKKGIEYIISVMNPQFGGFQIGDDAAWTHDFAAALEPYKKVVESPYLDYVTSKREYGEEPPKSRAYDDAKVAILRNSWANDYAIAAHFLSRGGGSHNHNDDLSLALNAYGNFLLVDTRMGSYAEEDPTERWLSSTRGHNTIEIDNTVARGGNKIYAYQMDPYVFARDKDGQVMVGEEGKLMQDDELLVPVNQGGTRPGNLFAENREFNNVYDYIKGSSLGYTDHNGAVIQYEDFQLERDVLFVRDGYFIVTDYAEPEKYLQNGKEHLYKQLWHFLPDAKMSIEGNVIRTNFPDKANVMLAAVDDGGIEVDWRYGLYAHSKQNIVTTKYAFFKQNKVGPMKFNTLIYPLPAYEDAEIETNNIEIEQPSEKASAFQAKVTDTVSKSEKVINYYTLRDESLKKDIAFGLFSTDGMLALVEQENDKNANAVLRGGKYIKDFKTAEPIIYSENELTDIGVCWQNDEIDIAYDAMDSYNTEIDLSKLTIMANGNVKTVRLNEEEIEFSQQGKYIYFGEEPIIEDDTVFSEEDNTIQNPPSHGTGESGSSGGGSSSGGSSKEETSKPEKQDTITPSTEKKPSEAYSKELNNHWAKEEISVLLDDMIVTGDEKGNLNLEKSVTRAEFIAMLIRAMKIDSGEYQGTFSDVGKGNWYTPYIEAAYSSGLIDGDGENFHPTKNITREEMTKIIVSAYENINGEIDELSHASFADEEGISKWAKRYVDKGVASKLINGMSDGTFMPKSNAKREQAMVLIYRLISKV